MNVIACSAALLVAFTAACCSCRCCEAPLAHADGHASSVAAPGSPKVVDARVLSQRTSSGIGEARREVLRDAIDWQEWWNWHANVQLPRPEPPEVDFTREMVLVFALGSRPTAGYGIELESLTQDSTRLTARAREVRPAPGSINATVMTQPVLFLAVPRFDGECVLELR